MNLANKNVLTRLISAAPPAVLRAGCVALFVCVSACSGGDDAAPPASPVSPAPVQAPSAGQCSTQPSPATALTIDSAASGNPVNLRVALSANGDGFAVWQANDGTRRNLWANRYCAATAGWGSPINIEASSNDIDEFDLTVDATGHAVVVWHEVSPVPVPPPPGPMSFDGPVMGTRFDAGSHGWAPPVLLNAEAGPPRVASNAAGDVLAVYVHGRLAYGRFYDPVRGTWLPETWIEMNSSGSGESAGPLAVVDGSGNALAYWRRIFTGGTSLGSAYYSRGNGGWPQPIPDRDGVAGSFVISGALQNLQLTTASDGNFLAAWENVTSPSGAGSREIKILTARFTSSTQEWSAVQTLVPEGGQNARLQRIGSDASGKVLVLWTEEGARTALKAMRVDDAGAACSAVQVIDSAVGGGAARADLGVDPQGQAIAIWQQFEGRNPDDGSRSNIAINRFDGATGTWAGAAFAETQPGNATSPHTSASGGHALLGWIQAEEGGNRVKALLQPLADTSH